MVQCTRTAVLFDEGVIIWNAQATARVAPAREREGYAMDLPKRKQIRLPEYDYSAPGAYFVTICTADRRCILSEIAVGATLVVARP